MMRKPLMLLATAATLMALSAQNAVAEGSKVLVELFTSQGCSSCPPADKLLGELGREDDVIALAYHVDYWDYLGWKDTFAQAEFTQRQRSYAPRVNREYIKRRLRGSFTPEIVVQGSDSLIGSAEKSVRARIDAHAAKPQIADVSITEDDGGLLVRLTPVRGQPADSRVMLARYRPSIEVSVERGENAGKTLTYSHVVTELLQIGRWDGTSAKSIKVSDIKGPAVVFLQRGAAGPVIAAADTE